MTASYQNSDMSDVSKSNSSIKSTSFEWNVIVFIVLAKAECLRSVNGSLVTLVYAWNLNQSSRSERKFIISLFSICATLRVDIVLWNELSKMASSSGKPFSCWNYFFFVFNHSNQVFNRL